MRFGGPRLLTALCYLNDVEEGGGTNFPRLNLTVEAKKGRIVVFENTLKNTNKKHPLSEHAGMPVLKGEKYAFNLWFRECPANMLYKTYNPEYYKKGEPIVRKRIIEKLKRDNMLKKNKKVNSSMIRHYKIKNTISNEIKTLSDPIFNIKIKDDFLTQKIKKNILNQVVLDKNKEKESHWIKTEKLEELNKKLENILGISKDFFEGYNLIKYNPNNIHNNFFDAWDLETENGINYSKPRGQRIYSVVMFLTPNIEYEFNSLNLKHNPKENSILLYKNTMLENNQRNINLKKTIINNCNNFGLVLNLYVIEKSIHNKWIYNIEKYVSIDFAQKKVEEKNISLEILEKENYYETYKELFNSLNKNNFTPQWKYKSLTFTHKINFNIFKDFLNKIQVEKKKYENNSLINDDLLSKSYIFDEYHPLLLNNVLKDGVCDIFKDLYKNALKDNVFPLGDYQSKRYKSNNEAAARILHYELLPLIEKITGNKLNPTYTYTSFYVKGADLPPHTDRCECEFTVSFIIDKPKDANWNIYVDPKKQPRKNIGQCKPLSLKEECIAVDCNTNGLMIFQGEDHCHFREKLEFDYYNILLLHYCKIN